MPRKKDYSTMSGAQIGRAVVLDNIAQWLISSEDENAKQMKRYLLKSDEWDAIYERLEELDVSEDDILECNRYNDLKKYMYKTFTVNELLIYYVVKASTAPLKAALYTACTQETIELKVSRQNEDVTELFHLHDGDYFINNFDEVIAEITAIREGMGTLYAMTALVYVLSRKFKIPQLKYYLLSLDDTENDINEINANFKTLKNIINLLEDDSDEETKKRAMRVNNALNKIPLPISLDDLQPTDDDIERAEQIMTRDVLSGGTPNELNILAMLDKGGRKWGT